MILGLVEHWLKLLLNIIHYIFILAAWVYRRRYFVVYIPLTISLWLYYEIKYTSPGCTFYSGRKAARLLSSCNFVFKSYRPPIYIFSCTLQWLYMCTFNNLELLSRLLHSNYFEYLGYLRRPLYYWISIICKLLIKSPFFRRLYNYDVFISQREIIESYGRSPIILDWYLPPWLVKKCSKCNRAKPSHQFMKCNNQRSHHINSKTNQSFSLIPSDKSFCDNYGQEYQRHFFGKRLNSLDKKSVDDNLSSADTRELYRSNTMKISIKPFSRFSFRRKNSSADQTKPQQITLNDNGRPIDSGNFCDEYYFEDLNMNFDENANNTQYNCSEASYYIQNVPGYYNTYVDNSVTRGIILILPDYNMPYNICNQHAGCICNAWDLKSRDKFKKITCQKCLMSLYKDAHSYNKETPCLSLTKLFIADALKAGFICVEIHLNVNLGLPIHINGHWLGMTSYPFSIYGNSISDLDCAIGRISSRYPHLPIQCVGFAGGCNILIEYLLRANDSRFVEKLNDEQNNSMLPAKGFELLQKPFEGNTKKSSSRFGGKISIKHANSPNDTDESFDLSSSETDNERGDVGSKKLGMNRSRMKKKLSEKFGEKLKSKNSAEQIDHLESIDSGMYQEVFTVKENDQLTDAVTSNAKDTLDLYKKKNKNNRKIVMMKRPKISDKGQYKSKIVDEKFKVYYNKVIHSASCINLNLKAGSEFFHLVTSTSQKQGFFKKYELLNVLFGIIRKLVSKVLNLNLLAKNYKNTCKNELRENIELLLRRIHCSRDVKNLDKNLCKTYQCCHYSTTIFNNIQSISTLNSASDKGFESQTLYALLILLHKEFYETYRESLNNHTVISRSSLLPVNNTNWTLTIGDGYYSKFSEGSNKLCGLLSPTDDIDAVLLKRNLRKLYDDNMKLVRNCLGSIDLPILFVSSLDNSLFGIQDIDVYQPIRNSNILHFVTQSGGDCTYLSGNSILI